MEKLFKQLEKEMMSKKGFGKPCINYSPLCINCIAWKNFNDLKYLWNL